MRVYVAGPYTQGDTAENVHKALKAAQRLLDNGHVPFVPHLYHLWHLIIPGPYQQWIALDLEWLKTCHALIRLPGDSVGGDKEVAFALELGIKVYFGIDDFLLKNPNPTSIPIKEVLPSVTRVPVTSQTPERSEDGVVNLQVVLNKIIFSLGPELAVVSWSRFPEGVCKVCRKSWSDHHKGGTFACPEVMDPLNREVE